MTRKSSSKLEPRAQSTGFLRQLRSKWYKRERPYAYILEFLVGQLDGVDGPRRGAASGQGDGSDGLDALARQCVCGHGERGGVHGRALVPHVVHGVRVRPLQGGVDRDVRPADIRGSVREVEAESPGDARRAAFHGSRDGVGVDCGHAIDAVRDQCLGAHHCRGSGVDAPAHPSACAWRRTCSQRTASLRPRYLLSQTGINDRQTDAVLEYICLLRFLERIFSVTIWSEQLASDETCEVCWFLLSRVWLELC